MPSTKEKNKFKNNVKTPKAPTLKTYAEAYATRGKKYQDMSKADYIKEAKAQNQEKYGDTDIGTKRTVDESNNLKNGKYKNLQAVRKKEVAAQAKKDATGEDAKRNKADAAAKKKKETDSTKMKTKKAVILNPKKGPASTPVDPNRKVSKLTSSNTKKKLDEGTFKEDKAATESKRKEVVTDKIKAGDKKAGKKAGLKGGLKRKANKAGKKVGKAKSKRTALDKAGEATTRKEVKKSGVRGKFKRAAMDDVASKKKQTKEKMEEVILSAATFKDFDQMDTKNAMETADVQAPSTMNDGPIKYFKQSIKYDVREATNPNLTSKARKHYSMNAEADMKSPGKMYKAPTEMYDAPTEMKGAKKKGGSILSKFMKSK